MAAGMAFAKAKVTPQLDTFTDTSRAGGGEGVGIVVRRNRLTMTLAGETVLRLDDVQAVERTTRTSWRITTADGVFDVERDKNCGCGG